MPGSTPPDRSTARAPALAPRRNVVLLHGQPGAGSDWDSVVRLLPDSVAVLASDRPGYGDSPHRPSGFADNAAVILQQMDDAGMDSAVVVGHSYGGGIALAMAALAPERVDALGLLASVGAGCLDGWDRLLAAPVTGEICALTAWWLTPPVARAGMAGIRRRRSGSLGDDEHLYLAVWANARHEHGAMWRTFLIEQRELVGNLALLDSYVDRVEVDTLVMADPDDKMIPLSTSEYLRDRIAGATLTLVPGGGHHLPRRVPESVAAGIAGLIGTSTAAGSRNPSPAAVGEAQPATVHGLPGEQS